MGHMRGGGSADIWRQKRRRILLLKTQNITGKKYIILKLARGYSIHFIYQNVCGTTLPLRFKTCLLSAHYEPDTKFDLVIHQTGVNLISNVVFIATSPFLITSKTL